MMYGVDFWGWEEQDELHKIVTIYGRWVIGLA